MGNPSFSRFKRIQSQAQAFLDEDDFALRDQAAISKWEKFAHFWLMVGRSFQKNRCVIRASALAYTTLLALVPVLAIVVSVSAGMLQKKGEEGIQRMIEDVVAKVAPQLDLLPKDNSFEGGGGSKEVAKRIFEYVQKFQRHTLSITAVIALLFVGISLLSTIESTFNDIWGVPCGRNLFTRVVQYWAAITLGPLLLLLVVGFATAPHFDFSKRLMEASPILEAIISSLIPFIGLALTFAGFYKLMPNTKVLWKAALIGGLVASGLWWLNSNLNVLYVSQVTRNSQIYGKLGLVPVFLIGLYLSWLILLFGAQVSYGFQNRQTYMQEKQAETVNARGREFIAFRIMTFVGQQFYLGETAPTLLQISDALTVPSRLVGKIVEQLLKFHLLVEAKGTEVGYVPTRPLDQISYQDVIEAMEIGQGKELATRDDPARLPLREEFERMKDAERQVASKLTLADFLQRVPPAKPVQPVEKGGSS